jgi:isoleucyl-tRNA synthetase
MSSAILRGGNLIVTEQGIRDGVRQVLIPLWNAWYFFSLYANVANGAAGYDAKINFDSSDVLDRYILAKTAHFVQSMTAELDALNIAAACDATRNFLDALSNWYIRRSRNRFWDGESAGSFAAFDTLFTVLEATTRTAAPLLPLTTEEIWRGLTGGRSVHLTDWPGASDLPADDDLVAAMDRVREVCSAASSLRKAGGLRVRLPLPMLSVVAEDVEALQPFAELIKDELNVRDLELAGLETLAAGYGVTQVLQVNARAAGPRLGKDVQVAIKASKAGDWSVAEDGSVTSGGIALQEGEYVLRIVIAEAGSNGQQAVAMLPRGGFVILDTTVTPELAAEGLARDVIRAVQQARRDAGLAVSDRISLRLAGDEVVRAAVEAYADLITSETLSAHLDLPEDLDGTTATVGTNQKITLTVQRI